MRRTSTAPLPGEDLNSVSSITKRHEIVEIDNCLDDLYLKQFDIPYPDDYFIKENRKKERSSYMTLMILVWGVVGYEWELE